MNLGRGQNEDDMWWRLLQCLQQGVECRLGEHMDFIDDIDLVPGNIGSEVYLFPQAADFVNAAIRGGIYLYQIQGSSPDERLTDGAGVARLSGIIGQTIHRLSQDTASAGLASSSGAEKEVGMCHPAGSQCI